MLKHELLQFRKVGPKASTVPLQESGGRHHYFLLPGTPPLGVSTIPLTFITFFPLDPAALAGSGSKGMLVPLDPEAPEISGASASRGGALKQAEDQD